MSQAVITIDAALRALASATTPDELIQLSNQAAALQVYARRAKLGIVAQNRCAEIRLRAERKLGELLTTTPRLHGRQKSVPAGNTFPRLSELGVPDRKISHRAQRIAAVPVAEFESYLRDAHRGGWEITTRHLLWSSERQQASARNRQKIVGGWVADLIKFAHNRPNIGCILIDPPWPIPGTSILPSRSPRSEPTPKSAGLHLKERLRLSHDRGPPHPTRLLTPICRRKRGKALKWLF